MLRASLAALGDRDFRVVCLAAHMQLFLGGTALPTARHVLDTDAAPAGHHVLHAYLPATEPYADWVGLDREAYREKKEARAAKQELRFEQSVPSAPAVEYSEPDHTTPLFGQGGRHCGTLCKLKGLVKQTRSNIAKELNAAMHD